MLKFDSILEAEKRIRPYIRETPLFALPALDAAVGCHVYVKAECMQVTGAFKARGALNTLLSLTEAERKNGVVAASSGNHGRAVAYGARMLGCSATIVVPDTAPAVKVEAIRALGAEVVLCEAPVRFQLAEQICREKGAALIHPYNDERVMAGQGTIGLEILKQRPDLDAAVLPVSGGGLIGGAATAIREQNKHIRVYGAEPAALPRYSRSLAAGKPVTVPPAKTVADALLTQQPGPLCFENVSAYVESVTPVTEGNILAAMKLLLTEGKILAEPSSCIGLAAVLQGDLKFEPEQKVCFVLSGGNVGLDQLKRFAQNW